MNEELLQSLKDFSKVSAQLEKAWNNASEDDYEILSKNYPFEKSFDELSYDICLWMESIKKSITE